MPNSPDVPWHHFLRSQFIGRLPDRDRDATLALLVHAITQQDETHAELRGMMEYSFDSSLPVLFGFTGSLALDSREISIEEIHVNQPGQKHSGQFSENGRVLTLRSHSEKGKISKPFHLVHAETLGLLTGDGS